MGAKYGITEDGHIPGHVLHRYLNDFADHFDIRRRIHFGIQVLEIEKLSQGWRLVTDTSNSILTVVYTCQKLIMATGLSSTANPINIRGVEEFGRPVINHVQLREEGARIAQDPNIKTVTVVGASKTGGGVHSRPAQAAQNRSKAELPGLIIRAIVWSSGIRQSLGLDF